MSHSSGALGETKRALGKTLAKWGAFADQVKAIRTKPDFLDKNDNHARPLLKVSVEPYSGPTREGRVVIDSSQN